jgi:hypothetical protein
VGGGGGERGERTNRVRETGYQHQEVEFLEGQDKVGGLTIARIVQGFVGTFYNWEVFRVGMFYGWDI